MLERRKASFLMLPTVSIRPSKLAALKNGHPWIFSGALESQQEFGGPGWVRIESGEKKDFLGYGFFNPKSQIALRRVSEDPASSPVSPLFWQEKLRKALDYRKQLGFMAGVKGEAFRILHAESDGFPGLCVDLFQRVAVLQSNSAAADAIKLDVARYLTEYLDLDAIFESSTAPVRKLEGLAPVSATLFGTVPKQLEIREGSARFLVNFELGQKTGFYLDQRDNRLKIAQDAEGSVFLNAFSYTGAFGVHAAIAGARHVVQMDSSLPALDLARENEGINKDSFPKITGFDYLNEDVLKFLAAKPEAIYDRLVLDPPKYITKRQDREAGLKRYTETFRLGFDLLGRRPSGGLVYLFSCSQGLGWEDLGRAVFLAARKAKVQVFIEEHLTQSRDHPVSTLVPESFYLKGFKVRVTQSSNEC